MSKKADNIMSDKDDSDDLPLEPEVAPERISSTDTGETSAAPRMERFGEGGEGSAARRERGATGARVGFFERVGTFWRDTRAELRRVAWPTAKEVQNTTIITIIAVIFFALYLFSVDRVLAFLITQLEHLVTYLFG